MTPLPEAIKRTNVILTTISIQFFSNIKRAIFNFIWKPRKNRLAKLNNNRTESLEKLSRKLRQVVMIQTFNPSTHESEAGASLKSRPAWYTQ